MNLNKKYQLYNQPSRDSTWIWALTFIVEAGLARIEFAACKFGTGGARSHRRRHIGRFACTSLSCRGRGCLLHIRLNLVLQYVLEGALHRPMVSLAETTLHQRYRRRNNLGFVHILNDLNVYHFTELDIAIRLSQHTSLFVRNCMKTSSLTTVVAELTPGGSLEASPNFDQLYKPIKVKFGDPKTWGIKYYFSFGHCLGHCDFINAKNTCYLK